MSVQLSVLVDARHGLDGALPAPAPGEEWLVAGPGQAIELAADSGEREVFSALVDRARGALCVWLRAGDRPRPGRHRLLRAAVLATGCPVVGHALPSTPGTRGGATGRLPPAAVLGALSVDTLAFRRDVAAFAPTGAPAGIRRGLALWALAHGGVGWVDRVLLDVAPRRLPAAPLAREAALARRVQAAHTAVSLAPPELGGRAAQQLVVAVEAWTAHRTTLESARGRLWWAESARAQAPRKLKS